MDAEAKAREIVEQAKRARKPLPRGLWVAAIAIAVVCVGALVVGWWTAGPRASDLGPRPESRLPVESSGFGTGLVVGLVAGIAIGTALAFRGRGPRPEARGPRP